MPVRPVPALSSTAPTYGIHILKAAMIFFQILAHAHIWAVQSHLFPNNLAPLWVKIGMGLGCCGMVVPMTAGAVLRMICTTDHHGRVINIAWPSMIGTMILLALFESLKEGLSYDISAFFMWNVLHLIAVTFLLTLFVAQYGMKILWSLAFTILFIAPFMIDILDPYETEILRVLNIPSWPLMGIVFAALITLFAAVVAFFLNRSQIFALKHKRRMFIIFGLIWCIAVFTFLHMRNGPATAGALKTIGVGALVGTHSGIHLWGFFPWAGTIMLGFLIYDVIVRSRADMRIMAFLLVVGILLLCVFFRYDASSAVVTLDAARGNVLSGYYMNRTPTLTMLIVGIFCVGAPISYIFARLGFEKKYIIQLSRCVLWIYIYQTSVLAILAPYFKNWLPADESFLVFALFSLTTSLALPLVLKHIPFRIHLHLKKTQAKLTPA